jgi:GNAT superfamily N-acetyltransferase
MEIRPYQDGDMEKIITLNEVVLDEFGFAFSQQLDRDVFDIPRYYTRRKGQYLLLLDGEKIVGSIAISKITYNVCKLRHFYMLPKYRHQGYGKKLYDRALEFVRGAGYEEIWLSSAPQFVDAIRFYERAGFVRTEKILWPFTRAGLFYILKPGRQPGS